jgi:CRP-like cAMP-binding protein
MIGFDGRTQAPATWSVPTPAVWAEAEEEAMEKLELLKELPLFTGLSDEALGRVVDRMVPRRLPRDAILFREGQPCQGLYILVEGRVVVYQASPDGWEYVLDSAKPGQSLAELPLFDGGPYPASTRAAGEEARPAAELPVPALAD